MRINYSVSDYYSRGRNICTSAEVYNTLIPLFHWHFNGFKFIDRWLGVPVMFPRQDSLISTIFHRTYYYNILLRISAWLLFSISGLYHNNTLYRYIYFSVTDFLRFYLFNYQKHFLNFTYLKYNIRAWLRFIYNLLNDILLLTIH